MSFADDLYAATNATLTTNVNAGMQIYYDKRFLERVNQELRMIPLGQMRDLPKGAGKQIQFFRWLNLAISLSGATLTEGQHPDATAIKGQNINATLAEYGAFAQLSSLLKKSHIDMNCSGAVEMFGEHAANVLEVACKSIVASRAAMPIRADQDSNAEYTGTFTSGVSTTGGTDSVLASTGFDSTGDEAHEARQSLITFLDGDAYGQQRHVLTHDGAGALTWTALDEAPATGDKYRICSPHGIASGDAITYELLVRMRTNLKKYRAPKHAGGYYVGIGSPDAIEDILLDDKFINAHTYKESMSTGMFTGEVGKFAGVRVIEDTLPFRFPITTLAADSSAYGVGAAGANYGTDAADVIESFFVMGKEAFGASTFKGQKGGARKPKVIIKTPGPNSTDQPLNRFGTVGWVTEAVYVGLNPLFGQQAWYYNDNA